MSLLYHSTDRPRRIAGATSDLRLPSQLQSTATFPLSVLTFRPAKDRRLSVAANTGEWVAHLSTILYRVSYRVRQRDRPPISLWQRPCNDTSFNEKGKIINNSIRNGENADRPALQQ